MGLNEDLSSYFDRRASGIRLDPPALRDIRARARKRQRNQRLATGISVIAVVAASIVGVRALTDNGETPERIQVFDDSGSVDTPPGTQNGDGGNGTGAPPAENGASAPPAATPNPEPQPLPTTEPPQPLDPEPAPTAVPAITPEPQPTPETQPTPTAVPAQDPELQPPPTTESTPPGPTATVQTPGLTETNCDYSHTDGNRYTPQGTDVSMIDFRNRDYRGCDLSGAALVNVDFSGSDLSGANLSGADLRYGFFNNAKLIEANLTESLLTGVDFNGADLTGADLSGSTRIYASFANAVVTGCTDCTPTVPVDGGSSQREAEERPRVPTPIVECSSDGNDVEVSWNEITGVGSYSVFLHLDRQSYLPGDLRTLASLTSYEFTGLNWSASYAVTVFALRDREGAGLYVDDSFPGTATCHTGANPGGLAASQKLPATIIDCSPGGDDFEVSGRYDVSWNGVPGAVEYYIAYQEEGDDVIISGGWQTHTTVRMDWAKPSTDYTISVQAFRDSSRTVIAAGEIGTARCSFGAEQ